ncbi:hypothetical protein ACHAXR_011556 [Thalassiosira sp. AJA248-18]
MMGTKGESAFVFNTQAWASVASCDHLFHMSTPRLHHETAQIASYLGGEEPPRPQHIMGGRGLFPDSSSLEEDARYPSKQSAVAMKTATACGNNRSPSPPLTRAKSSPSLASTRRRAEGGRPGSNKKTSININNDDWGRSVSDLAHESKLSCVLHPQVRIRSNRCPLCAAGEVKKMGRKSFGNRSASSSNELHKKQQQVPLRQEAKDDDHSGSSGGINNATEDTSLYKTEDAEEEEDEGEEIEEVSLDAKWADALRGISERLANEKSQQSTNGAFKDNGDQSFTDTDPKEGTSLDIPVVFGEVESLESCNSLHNPYIMSTPRRNSYIDLKRTIEQATKSFGTYTPGIDDEEDEDNISRSSIARDTPVTKVFAESKGPSPQRGCSHTQQHYREDHLSRGLGVLGRTKLVGSDVMTSECSNRSSGSESSVTLSVTSAYTMQSYNSLMAAPSAPSNATFPIAPTGSNETSASPISVINGRATLDSHYHSEEESSEEEEDEDRDFENSFFIADPKKFSEKKMATPTSSIRKGLNNESRDQENISPDSLPAPTVSNKHHSTRTQASSTTPRRRSSFRSSRSTKSDNQHSVLVEDISGDIEDDASTVASSFFAALVHNSRSRSCSRPRKSASRSKSRGREAVSRSKSRGRKDPAVVLDLRDPPVVRNSRSKSRGRKNVGASEAARPRKPNSTVIEHQERQGPKMDEHNDFPPKKSIAVPQEYAQQKIKARPVSQPDIDTSKGPQEDSTHCLERNCSPPRERGPITHPSYKLGDLARDEDMIVFPKTKSRRRRSRRRRRKNRDCSQDSSSCSDRDDDEEEVAHSRTSEVDFALLAIGQLCHLDAAMVRRSDGKWTYALVADGDSNQVRFVVNDRGSTKSYPKSLWKSCVRRIRVLTPRKGDRLPANTKTSRKKRSVTRSRSFRGRGRLVSPSPTRRFSNILNLPPTIFEDKEYN